MSLLERKSLKGSDNFQTPDWPLEKLYRHIEQKSELSLQDKIIWDPCCGKGNIVNYFINNGITSNGTDIEKGIDFLKDKIVLGNDVVIITNPPYSKKTKFLEKCYEYKKPFALLLPYSTFETEARQTMFKNNGLQVLFLPKRVDFEYEDGTYKKSPWFATCWITNGFNFKKDMVFLD